MLALVSLHDLDDECRAVGGDALESIEPLCRLVRILATLGPYPAVREDFDRAGQEPDATHSVSSIFSLQVSPEQS